MVLARTCAPLGPRLRRARRGGGAIALVAVLLAAGGCMLDTEPPALPEPTLSSAPMRAPTPTASPTAELARFYGQELDWAACRDRFQCAQVEVPLDYDDPGGESIELALLKVPSPGGGERVGSLLVNPGGPGVSGLDFAARADTYFGSELRQTFDIVGFDPRGVGSSTPVQCLSDERLDAYVASDPDPDTEAEAARAAALMRSFGRGCVERSGALAAHVSTVEAARDIDIIRSALGDRRLSWFGASYGTLLGATYAELFPRRVGRMVLDAAIDPSLSPVETALSQARGFEVALRSYVGACVQRGGCFLGDGVDAGTARVRELLDRVEREPLPGLGGRQLRIGNAVLGVWMPLYDERFWPLLDQALQAALAGDGRMLLALSDAYVSRGPEGYLNNSLEALHAINCLDATGSVSVAEAEALVPRFEEASPTFGSVFAYGLAGCTGWPVDGPPVPAIDADGAAPILVVGTTRDPATPVAWARGLADQLDSGVLLVRDGDGHGGYSAGNECVDRVVESYLVSGTVPESGTRC